MRRRDDEHLLPSAAPAPGRARASGGRAWRQPAALLIGLIGLCVIGASSRGLHGITLMAAAPQSSFDEQRVVAAERRAAEAEEALRILQQHVDSAAASPRTPSTKRTFSIKQTSSPQLPLNVNPHSSRRLASICSKLAPAVAVRPAPLQASFAAQHAVRYSPWLWGSSSARLTFDPDGIVGALSTPWGDDGRWGSLPRHTQDHLLWATFAWRSHLLWVRRCSIVSHRCEDNQTVVAHVDPQVQRDCQETDGSSDSTNQSVAAGGESASVDDDDDDEDDEGDDV